MKIYIEEIEDMSTHGVTFYSLVQGMDVYHADVRASGIDITAYSLDTGEHSPIDNEEKEQELIAALTAEIYKEK